MSFAFSSRSLLLFAVCGIFSVPVSAQVSLRYVMGNESVVVTALSGQRPMYMKGGRLFGAQVGGRWFVESSPLFADPSGELEILQETNALAPSGPEGLPLAVRVRLTFHADAPSTGLYFFCSWEDGGRLLAIDLGQFPDALPGQPVSVETGLRFKKTGEHGILHVYLFHAGRSLTGVDKGHAGLAPLRALLDCGNIAGATQWLRGPGQGASLPQSMVEQIAQLGDGPLLEMAMSGPNAVRRKGADGGRTLLAAAQAGRDACVAVLLGWKINPNSTNARGDTALYLGIKAASAGVVKQLLEAGANPNRGAPRELKSPLVAALAYGHFDIVTLLLEHGVKLPDKKTREELMVSALNHGEVGLASFLLSHGANVDEFIGDAPLLMLAAMRGDAPMVKRLLEGGAKVEARNAFGETPIMGAAYSGNEEVIELLKKAGASLTATSQKNRAAPSFALQGGHLELALTLMAENPPSDPSASRLLHDALIAEADVLVQVLMAKNVDLDLALPDLDEALDRVMAHGYAPLLKSALDRGLDPNRRLFDAWSLAALAKRYAQADLLAELEPRAQGRLVEVAPIGVSGEVLMLNRRADIVPQRFGAFSNEGSAVIDLFIDSAGFVRVPIVESASDAFFGNALVRALLTCRYVPQDAGKSGIMIGRRDYDVPIKTPAGAWRHTRFEWGDAANAVARLAELGVTQPPMRKDNWLPAAILADDHAMPQAAVVKMKITDKGVVESPEIITISQPEMTAEAVALVKKWQFFPAKAGNTPLPSIGIAIVLMPDGSMPNRDNLFALSTPRTAHLPVPKIRRRSSFAAYQQGIPRWTKPGVVVVRFVVNTLGFTSHIKVVGSSDPELSKRAVKLCDDFEFEPTVVNGEILERPMIWLAAPGDWEGLPPTLR